MRKIQLFTDGACSGNPGHGGIGIILKHNNHIKEISRGYKNTTNNRMELRAVITGLEQLREKCFVSVFTDSKYIVDSINKGWVYRWQKNGWKRNKKDKALNTDLWSKLINLTDYHHVEFNWVKGHAGHPENERCDKMALKALNQENLETDKIELH